jgi:hypothetical protein
MDHPTRRGFDRPSVRPTSWLAFHTLSFAPTLWVAALCVLCAHFGGSILWVFSTVLLQMEVPDRFRGRVFATELAFVTLMSSA